MLQLNFKTPLNLVVVSSWNFVFSWSCSWLGVRCRSASEERNEANPDAGASAPLAHCFGTLFLQQLEICGATAVQPGLI